MKALPTAADEGHEGALVEGKGTRTGWVAPGISGSGTRGSATASEPPTGWSGKAGRVMGWSRDGSILTLPSG